MKFFAYHMPHSEKEELAVANAENENILYPLEQFGMHFADMTDLIERITPAEESLLQLIATNPREGMHFVLKDGVILHAPIAHPRQDVICLGINYAAHAEESARYKKEVFEKDRVYAIYFSKRVNEAVAHGGTVPAYENLVDSLDYEAELAVIIGKDCKNATVENAYDYVFGYTIVNDISARNLQTRHKQWYFGKGLDGFTPMGPCIVTADEIAAPPTLAIRSYVNGELRQNSNTDMLMHDIAHIIADLSQGMTLKAGTIIATGTPAGVGMGMEPPTFLKPGDTVSCEIEKIGILTVTIK